MKTLYKKKPKGATWKNLPYTSWRLKRLRESPFLHSWDLYSLKYGEKELQYKHSRNLLIVIVTITAFLLMHSNGESIGSIFTILIESLKESFK